MPLLFLPSLPLLASPKEPERDVRPVGSKPVGRHAKGWLESGILLQDPHCLKGTSAFPANNYSRGGADGLSGRGQNIAWEEQGKRKSILQERINSSQIYLFCTVSSLAKCLEHKHCMLWLMHYLPDSPLPDLLELLIIWVTSLSPCPFFTSCKNFTLKFLRKEKQVCHGLSGWVS